MIRWLCGGMFTNGGVLTGISGAYWNRCLPVSACDHLLCHFTSQDFFAAVFMSHRLVGVLVSHVSASVAASFASLSAISFPAMLACPGVQEISF